MFRLVWKLVRMPFLCAGSFFLFFVVIFGLQMAGCGGQREAQQIKNGHAEMQHNLFGRQHLQTLPKRSY